MRLVKNPQLQFGETDISEIRFDPKSRDDVPQLLKGLQHIYVTPEIRHKVFTILESAIANRVSLNRGRPGMELWKILVMGVLRLNLNCDYDRLHELVNQHRTIRAMLGHGVNWEDLTEYHLQTLKDNVSLLTPEILDKINTVVVEAGHTLLKKNEEESLQARCDSFVVETSVHYPTDINLLWDAMRTVIEQMANVCRDYRLSDWRQHRHNLIELKQLFKSARKSNQSKAKSAEAQKQKAHTHYLNKTQWFIDKVQFTLEKLKLLAAPVWTLRHIANNLSHAQRQVSQIHRRVLKGEQIPNDEKIYSIFQPHTEWVSKGKAGVPVELGVKVCVMECQHGFILHHRVMENEQDVDVAVVMVRATQAKFPMLHQCSFDKGFHSPDNQLLLASELEKVVLPKKGRLSIKEKKRESDEKFKKARKQHSAVESAINALEVHGLDRCPDHGINGFRRYVSLAVLARNVQKLGALLYQQEKEERFHQAKRSRKKAA
ncbi:ISNCY family transposase [Spartinivicinus marinus]|nr:ISNCY family transposase [Spartinivicinus marinus]MCX4025031.1 ISNCY family transposase [Spartinivicinus marinus]MCX4025370.1 ISNCY family transposase [Spartinivicinus marinus]MCX4029163.1 ISNCY family transposase [Spartinivicinus marinus]